MSDPQRLGAFKFEVFFEEETGKVDVKYEPDFSEAVSTMLAAMSGSEQLEALALRRRAMAATADFFLFCRNPDDPHEAT